MERMINSHQQVRTHHSPYCFAEILSDPTVTSRLSDTKVILYSALFIYFCKVSYFRLNSEYIFPLNGIWNIYVELSGCRRGKSAGGFLQDAPT